MRKKAACSVPQSGHKAIQAPLLDRQVERQIEVVKLKVARVLEGLERLPPGNAKGSAFI